MTPIIFLFVGLILLFLEFYTPGGILATVGIVCVVVSLVSYISSSSSILDSSLFVLFSLALVVATVWFALYSIRRSSKKNTFYLDSDQEGYQAASYDAHLIGKTGKALTDLGPSGFVLIEGTRIQARSRGSYIDKGSLVEVIGGEGAHLIVKKYDRV